MNKGLLMVGLLVVSMSVGALAQGFMGPPTAELNKNQWNVGYNYTYSDIDLNKVNLKWADLNLASSGKGKLKIEDLKTQRHYVSLGYGLTSWWEVYAQLGFADVKGQGTTVGTDIPWKSGLNFDNDIVWGWGTRLTLAEEGRVKWGLSGQMNWLNTSVDNSISALPDSTEINIDYFDLLVAFGPTIDLGSWKVYGGPFYYYLSGNYDLKASQAGAVWWKESADLENDGYIGGFIGTQFALSHNMDLRTEFSATADGWAVGTSVGWNF